MKILLLALLVLGADQPNNELDKIFEDSEKASVQINEWHQASDPSSPDYKEIVEKINSRYLGVVNAYKKFLETHADNTLALMCLGDFLNDIGKEEEAIEYWKKVTELDPSNSDAWNSLANAEGHHGDVRVAFTYYKRAIDLTMTAEPSAELSSRRALYYQNYATTVFLFRKYVIEVSKKPNGEAFTESDVFDMALALYQEALDCDPKNLQILKDRAMLYDGIRPYRIEAAINAWKALKENALEAKESFLVDDALVHIARFEIQAKRFDKAKEILHQIDDSEPADFSSASEADQQLWHAVQAFKKRLLKQISKAESL